MTIKLVPVSPDKKDMLINLYQLYEYDFSKYTHQDIDTNNGRYDVNIDFYWEGDGRWNPFFIEVDGFIAGFLVILFENMDIDPDPTHVIYDFMILQKYRRKGIGRTGAIKAFNMYKAPWAVSQMDTNLPAIAFWRSVIQELKGDNFSESYNADRKKYIQKFSTRI